MTRFIYTKDGAEPRSWDFDPNKLLSPEGEAIERVTGWSFREWLGKLDESVLAIHALLWVFLKRDFPLLRFDEVEFSMSEIDMELDAAELKEAIGKLQLKQDRTSEEQQALDELLLRQMADGSPKDEATSQSAGSSGSLDSPST